MAKTLYCENPDCPKDWEKLAESGDRVIRICTVCFKAVYLCKSEEEAKLHEASDHRAAVPD